jgi:hypothetical protein
MTDLITEWQPPAGMLPPMVREWRTFYRHILSTYGVTPAEYRALYLAQLGRCYICRDAKGKHPDDPNAKGGRRLGIDHNHVIGYRREAVRGLLCTGGDRTCNRIIGWLTYPALQRAALYVAESPAQSVFAALAQGYGDAEVQGMLTRA